MKKSLLFLMITVFIGISMTGCATWHGVKKDSKEVWNVAKS